MTSFIRKKLSDLRSFLRHKIQNPNIEFYRIHAPKKDKNLRKEFKDVSAYLAMQELLDNYQFSTVLDIGSGAGYHSEIFKKYNKIVTSLDYGNSPYFEKNQNKEQNIIADYNTHSFTERFDCIWASHILEHQPNPNLFLKKLFYDLNEGGIAAITVPPMKKNIVGGHVNLYNAGILTYQMVLAGFDCKDAQLLRYGYNISIIVQKKSRDMSINLGFDKGDLKKLKEHFPKNLHTSIENKNTFNGNF